MGVRPPMGLVIAAMVLMLPGGAFAQDDDEAWNEITGLMNGMAGAIQRLPGGMQWMPGVNPSGSQYLDQLALWARMYAGLLNSVDGAFSPDGLVGAGSQFHDSFDPLGPDPVAQQMQLLRQMRPDVMQAYQNGLLYRQYAPYRPAPLQGIPPHPQYRPYQDNQPHQ